MYPCRLGSRVQAGHIGRRFSACDRCAPETVVARAPLDAAAGDLHAVLVLPVPACVLWLACGLWLVCDLWLACGLLRLSACRGTRAKRRHEQAGNANRGYSIHLPSPSDRKFSLASFRAFGQCDCIAPIRCCLAVSSEHVAPALARLQCQLSQNRACLDVKGRSGNMPKSQYWRCFSRVFRCARPRAGRWIH